MNDSTKNETRSTDENGSLQSEESERCTVIILPTTPRIFHVPEISHFSASSSSLTSLPVSGRYPLLTLLRCIAERLLLRDWVNLRDHISKYVPLRALENTQNGIKLFEELVNRNLISDGNFDFIRNAFYEIQRIDIVHLIDCVQDGDYRLLTEQQPRRSGSRDTAVPNGLPAPRQQMRDLTLGGAPEAIYDSNYTRRSPHAATNGDSRDERDSGVLQRKYRDVPRGSQLSSSYHAQENGNTTTTTAESSTSYESTATDSDSRRTERASGPDSDTLTRNRDSENLNSEPANSQGVSSEGAHSEGAQSGGAAAWVENPEWSCEHYDRYCDVQFSCCSNRFWPCHRCHNANSSCSTRKLRSRDIKKLKCKRCGKIQEFPQISPHCVECNIKFSDYFCPICQHLTGTVNHPFHCDKCGICRVHSDSSFHCDGCGVCLDVQLRGNHRCRAGSANDECRIRPEDACQTLPCSHKATAMLPNRINRTIEQGISSGIQETHQNLEDQSEAEEPFSNNQHAPRPQATVYRQASIFENYIPATIDTNFQFIREDVPTITDSLGGKG